MTDNKKYGVIIFLTAEYPFGHGETFVENEIRFLKENCKKLVIVPFRSDVKCDCRLDEDQAVEIFRLNKSCLRWFMSLLVGLVSRKVWTEWRHLWKTNQRSLYKCGCVLWFFAKARVRFSQVQQIVRRWNHTEKLLIYCYWAGVQACVAAKLKSINSTIVVVTRAHGYDLYQDRPEYIPFYRETFRVIDEIFPVSEHGASYLCNRFPMFKEKISAFYLGTNDYGMNEVLSGQIFHIVSCSSMVALKRIHLIIEALSMMSQNIRWTHYGTGPLKKELEEKACLLPNNIQWTFRGNVPNQKLMDEYKNTGIDLFVNVSTSEGLPVSIMEASSFGIPIIATNVGGTPEIVEDGVNGYILPSDLTGEQLKNAIEKFLLLSLKQKEKMRLHARTIWKQKFFAEDNYNIFYANLEKYL